MARGRKTGGRGKGGRNKATLEREEKARLDLIAQIERERGATEMSTDVAAAAEIVADAKVAGVKLAKDVLQDFMQLFAGKAAFHQAWPPAMGKNPNEDPKEFLSNAQMAVSIAKDLAPYQSPKLTAVMVGADVVTKIVVIGGLPDEKDGGLYPSKNAVSDEPLADTGGSERQGRPAVGLIGGA
jgi:hypothetical protein